MNLVCGQCEAGAVIAIVFLKSLQLLCCFRLEMGHPLAAFLEQDAPVPTVKCLLFSCSVLTVRVAAPVNLI